MSDIHVSTAIKYLRKHRRTLEEYTASFQKASDASLSLEASLRSETTGLEKLFDGLSGDPFFENWSVGHLAAHMRTCRLYVGEATTALKHLSTDLRLRSFLSPFESMARFCEVEAIRCEEVLREHGALVPPLSNAVDNHVQHIVQQITSKQQIKVELLKACTEMKINAPSDLHSEIDRSFRKALDELQESD